MSQVIEIDRRKQERMKLDRKASKAKGRLLKSLSRKGFEFSGHAVNKVGDTHKIILRIDDSFSHRKSEIPEIHEGYPVDCQFVGKASTDW